jgi:hypothetical protein
MRTISTRIRYTLNKRNTFDTAPLETLRREVAEMIRHLGTASAILAELEVHDNENQCTVENLRNSGALACMLRGTIENLRPIVQRSTDDLTYQISVRNDISDSIDCGA